MAFSVRNGGAWVNVGVQRVWVSVGGVWTLVSTLRRKGVGDGAGPWVTFYDAYPFVAPTGSIGTVPAGGVGLGTFTASNRRSDWRIVGSALVRNGSGVAGTPAVIDALSNSVTKGLESVTPGTVEFTIRYFNPTANTYTGFATITRAYTLPS